MTVFKSTSELRVNFFPQATFSCSMFYKTSSETVLHTARNLLTCGKVVICYTEWHLVKNTQKKNYEVERERRRRENQSSHREALCLIWITFKPAEVPYLNDFAKEVVLSNLFKSFLPYMNNLPTATIWEHSDEI